MKEQIIQGIINNIWMVGFSLLLLVGGTFQAWRKFGLKRVLLGKKNEHRELVYKRESGSIKWRETLGTWFIIFTGGMNVLSLFLLLILIILSFVYQHDIQATRSNDEKLCQEFGTIYPTRADLVIFNMGNRYNLNELNITTRIPLYYELGDNKTIYTREGENFVEVKNEPRT